MARIDFGGLAAGPAPAGDSADALYELGVRYSVGRGVKPDLVAAHTWFNLAAMRGNADARRCRAEIAAELTKAQLAKAQRLAREWMPRR